MDEGNTFLLFIPEIKFFKWIQQKYATFLTMKFSDTQMLKNKSWLIWGVLIIMMEVLFCAWIFFLYVFLD